ncbi:MAG TPA: hypothetical protein VIQ02_03875, partial [Jiangellaceae bacterium]
RVGAGPARTAGVVSAAGVGGRRQGTLDVPAGISTLIVEGVGAARRELADVVDACVWVVVAPPPAR